MCPTVAKLCPIWSHWNQRKGTRNDFFSSQKFSKIIRKFPFFHFLAFVSCFTFGILFAVESHFGFDKLLIMLQVDNLG